MNYENLAPRKLLRWLSMAVAALVLSSVSLSGASFAQEVPDNATSWRVGSGWKCNDDFLRSQGECVAVVVPPNAYRSEASYARGWECSHGFTMENEACVAIPVPSNAYLMASGSRWSCERGYMAEEDACRKIIVPANAYLTETTYDDGWKCERGYRANGQTCVFIEVPENGYLTAASSYGTGWACERGYMASTSVCSPVTAPEFAHLNHNGDAWECDRPYNRVGKTCVAP